MNNPDKYTIIFIWLRSADFDSVHMFAHWRHKFAQKRETGGEELEIEKGPACASPTPLPMFVRSLVARQVFQKPVLVEDINVIVHHEGREPLLRAVGA